MSKRMLAAILISIFLHVTAAGYFWLSREGSTSTAKQGSINVDFIESFAHDENDGHAEDDPGHRENLRPARRPPAPAPTTAPSGPPRSQPVGDPRGNITDSYIATVSQIIQKRKVYPRAALDREEQGRVVIGFSLDRQGQVLNARVEQPSPFNRLNEAALSTVSGSEKFPELPPEIEAPLHLHVPLVFRIDN